MHNESQVEQFEGGISPFKKSELYHSFKILNGESQMKQNNFYRELKKILETTHEARAEVFHENNNFISFASIKKLQERFAKKFDAPMYAVFPQEGEKYDMWDDVDGILPPKPSFYSNTSTILDEENDLDVEY